MPILRSDTRFATNLADYLCRIFIMLPFIFLTGYSAIAQDITLSVTVTNETCAGNGKLSFAITGAAPSPPVNYQVYLLPNTTNPIYNNTNPTVTNLTDGNYLVIATQTLNGSTATDQEEVVIEDNITPLLYQVSGNNTYCGDDGTIVINVSQGNPQTYEIITGPVVYGPQSANQFTGLPAGNYTVRVTDTCGEGIVKAYTVFSDEPILTVGPAYFPDTALPACDLITAAHDVSPQDPDLIIAMPLTVTFTVYPPGGGTPIEYTQVFNGDPSGDSVQQVIPFYYDTDYYYDLEIIDNCGREYIIENNLVRQKLTIVAGFDNAGCGGKFLIIDVYKFLPPYTITIEFTDSPDDFDPSEFNTDYPGPFTESNSMYGEEGVPVPFGTYEITVTDECERSETVTLVLEEPELQDALSSVLNNDCENNLGKTEIIVPGYVLIGGNILDAPDEYTEQLPFDLSDYVNDDDNVEIGNLPPGAYQFEVFDDCGNTYPVEVVIPPFAASPTTYNARPDCSLGKGTIRIGGSYTLTSVSIIAAPAAFTETLPYDASAYLTNAGVLLMDNLPPGNYKFATAIACGQEQEINAIVKAYEVVSSNVYETRHCGSFDVTVEHESNGVAFVKFWLQKLTDAATDTWGHPITGAPYTDGTLPLNNNSIELTNNATVYNIISTGQFRVLKTFRTFGSAEEEKNCIEELYEFEFYDDLVITNIESLTCTGDIADVEVTAVGAEPLTYKIISKDGDQSFQIDNGTDNIFTNLESAVYELRVDDPCGNFDTYFFNVADLPSLVTATAPDDIELCDEGNDGTEIIDLSLLDETILNGQSADEVTLTYYTTLSDAEEGNNPLPASYTAGTGNVRIYVKVAYNGSAGCVAITSFEIKIRPLPVLNLSDTMALCEDSSITITADAGYESYLWSTEEETRTITVTEPGNYTLTVTDEYGCQAEKTITVVETEIPVISDIITEDWTDTDNVITVLLENTTSAENFEYSLDGITYQDSNTFTGLVPGRYDVYVRDKYNCGNDSGDISLLTYPKFFTPNGDGVNEKWRIAFSMAEPNLHVYIFDRYGKVITGFGSGSEGWDGTYNGVKLPATDYWFTVIRENGKEYKGHFAMIR